MQGKNDGGKIGYMGPAPSSGTHRYFFRLYALDRMLDLGVRATHKEVSDAIKGHVLAQAELMGRYANKREQVAWASAGFDPDFRAHKKSDSRTFIGSKTL